MFLLGGALVSKSTVCDWNKTPGVANKPCITKRLFIHYLKATQGDLTYIQCDSIRVVVCYTFYTTVHEKNNVLCMGAQCTLLFTMLFVGHSVFKLH